MMTKMTKNKKKTKTINIYGIICIYEGTIEEVILHRTMKDLCAELINSGEEQIIDYARFLQSNFDYHKKWSDSPDNDWEYHFFERKI